MNEMNATELFKSHKKRLNKLKDNNICHLVYTPFTGLGSRNGYRGDDWFRRRIEIFKKYTMKSLVNQREQFFVHWVSFRPEEQDNPLTKRLFSYICGEEYRSIFTFGGLCWRDDKKFSRIIYKLFGKKVNNDKILKRLKDTLPALEELVQDAKYVYKTIISSDDMYHKDLIRTIQKEPFEENKAVVCWNGYIYNDITGELAEWNPERPGHCPPFYTIMYKAETFLNPKKHLDYFKDFKSHEDIERVFDCKILEERLYCVVVHGKNISTVWNKKEGERHQYIGKEFTDEKVKKDILKDFGIGYEITNQ